MPTERELKFSLLDDYLPSRPEIEATLSSIGLTVVHSDTLRQRDRYYDDARRSLALAGVALRRRSVGGRRLATLKTRGEVDGAYHRREELELPLEGAAWPAEVAERVTDLSGLADLTTLETRVRLDADRLLYTLGRDGGREVATLCFDRVEASLPGSEQSVHFSEVEIEALGDTSRDELERIAGRVDRVVRLSASGVTKLERAEALLAFGAGLR